MYRFLALLACIGTASGLAGVAAPLRSMTSARAELQMGVPVANFDGTKSGEEEVALKVAKAGAYVVHRKVVAEQANMRLGTACTKTRTEVRGGGRKPYQQKGTGNARRGSNRSPLVVGGGVLFGPKPKSYRLNMNKKEKRVAISTALMSATGRMTLIEDFEDKFSAPKSAEMRQLLERLDVDTKNRESTLMIIKSKHENTYLSARNIPYLNLISLDNINARDILKAKKVVVSKGAMSELTARYGA